MGAAQLMAILPLIQAKGCAFTELSPGQILHGFASGSVTVNSQDSCWSAPHFLLV